MAEMQSQTTLNNQLLPEERRLRILERLQQDGRVSVAELQEEFHCSAITIRRDLEILEHQGLLKRTYGGAILPDLVAHEDSFLQRLERNVDAKKALAKAALDLIEKGEALFLDSSTTAYYFAQQLLSVSIQLTIITNSLPIIRLIAESHAPHLEVISVGGILRKLTLSFVGAPAIATITSVYADKLFFSVKGVSPSGILTDPDSQEAEVKRTMLKQSRQAFLLIDASKLTHHGLYVIADIQQCASVLAAEMSSSQQAQLRKLGVAVRGV